MRRDRFVGEQRLDIFVKDIGLAVGELLERGKGGVQLRFAFQRDRELGDPLLERIAAREFAQHDLVGAPADVLGPHDLVRVARLQHTVLMDAGRVRKCIRADHCLVRLHGKSGDTGDQL